MLRDAAAFSGFSVDDIGSARTFYGDVLGLDAHDVPGMGALLELRLTGGGRVLLYEKPDHQPATYTVLNFPVPDVDATVDGLTARGVRFEQYEGFGQDEKGIARNPHGPAIAWFRDPAGNVLSVLEQAAQA